MFEEDPQNTTCELGRSFIISCRPPGYSATARWLFGGERLYITHPPPGVHPSSRGNLFELDMTCVPERHYLTIQCIAVIDIGVEEDSSPPVWVKVEGFPDRVERVYVSSSNCSGINLGWDSVPAVPGHQVTYCVAVYNITRRPGEGQTTTALETEVCVLRETIFVLTVVADTSPLHVFEFTVTARTEVGPGPTSQTLQANFTFDNDDVTCGATPTEGEVFASTSSTSTEEDRVSSTKAGSTEARSTEAGSTEGGALITEGGGSTELEGVALSTEGGALSLPVIISIASGILLFLAVGVLSVICCFVIIGCKKRTSKDKENVMEMMPCDAYQNPMECSKKDFTSYESIPEMLHVEDHVYEHIM